MKFRALFKNAPKTLRKGADFWIATQGVSFVCNDVKRHALNLAKLAMTRFWSAAQKPAQLFLLALMAHFQTKSPKSPLNKAQNSNIKISKTSLKAQI